MTKFEYAPDIHTGYPELVSRTLRADGIRSDVQLGDRMVRFEDIARRRLATSTESAFPEIQAWRRAFSRMGLRPTDYRCASEALLRRFRREGSLPRLHPLVDLCNSVSLATAIPIAVFDLERIEGDLTVRHAIGNESYLTFGGEVESPKPGEVIFVDQAGNAHARRWTNRQSSLSAVRPETRSVLIVAEAMHATGVEDTSALVQTLTAELAEVWEPILEGD